MKKRNNLFMLTILAIVLIAGCKKEPEDITITASKTVAAVNEEITFSINDPEEFDNIIWYITDTSNNTISEAIYTTVSGGGEEDLKWTVKIAEKGTYVVHASANSLSANNTGDSIEITIQ